MLEPELSQPKIELHGLVVRFDSNRVPPLDRHPPRCCRLEEENGVVARELLQPRSPRELQEFVGTAWPIRSAVDRPSIAEQDPIGIERGLNVLEVALHLVDGKLRRFTCMKLVRPRKSSAEKHRGRLGNDDDALTD